MGLHWNTKILLAAVETTYGEDVTPAAANGVLTKDLAIMPMEGNDQERDLDLPYMGGRGAISTNLHAKLTFKVELAGRGIAGTPPAWGPLIRACGCAEVLPVGQDVVEYSPVSDSHESVSFYFFLDRTRHRILGARGTCKIVLEAENIPYLEFEFTGLWAQPTEAARVIPSNFAQFQKPFAVSSDNTPVFTLDGTALTMRSFSLDFGNQIEPRFLVGGESILIADRREVVEAVVEAVPVTSFNVYSLARSRATFPLRLTHGTGAGLTTEIEVDAAQMMRLNALNEEQGVAEWPLRMSAEVQSGNDQFLIRCS
ncbi:MAG: phage tail tube protein [Pseudomonadota bacterium]